MWIVVFHLLALAQSPITTDSQPLRFKQLTHDGCYKTRPFWLKDGTRLLFAKHAGKRIDLVSVAADGSNERRVGDSKDQLLYFDAAISPDGKTLAFTRLSIANNQGDADIYLMNADGGNPRPLAVNDQKLSHEEWACWSPDGKQVAYSSTAPGNQEIMVVDVGGKNRRRLTQHPATDAHPAWSPDGKSIAFATDRWGGMEIAVMNPEGGEIRRLTKSPGLDDYPAWSPDGKRLAFVSNRDGNLEIYTMLADGSWQTNCTNSRTQDTYPCWSPDGKSIAYVRGDNQRFDIVALDVTP